MMVRLRNGFAEFSFYRPSASVIYLAGDFNNWQTGQLPMRRDERGYWSASLRLPSGEYKFRYWVDGQWFCDFASFGVEYGPFGPDSIVRIAEARPEMSRQRQSADNFCRL
jgi:1,4-alpha-glucan branching enzyme